jgi:mRNA capping enzyme, catalytic domain
VSTERSPPPRATRPSQVLRAAWRSSQGAGPLQDKTLLDGEMVVDEDIVTGVRTRRYLAYDLVALQGASLVLRPFKVGRVSLRPFSS